jgi:hypothetical protein
MRKNPEKLFTIHPDGQNRIVKAKILGTCPDAFDQASHASTLTAAATFQVEASCEHWTHHESIHPPLAVSAAMTEPAVG